MTELRLTRHAERRIRQRGLRERGIALILQCGAETGSGFMVRRKDLASLEQEWKRLRSTLERLVGKVVVAEGSTVITVYHARKSQERWLLQH